MEYSIGGIIGRNISNLRKGRGITQDVLAGELGVSFQAVSKWETGQSCPDISLLPVIADFFDVTIDELLGRIVTTKTANTEPHYDIVMAVPWQDDEKIRMVVFQGKKLLEKQESVNEFTFRLEGEARDVECHGNIEGDVNAGGNVMCANVAGYVSSYGNVTCADVGSSVEAKGNVNCADIGGNVEAKGNVNCADIGGKVITNRDVNCADVGGSVTTDRGSVNCMSVGGSVTTDSGAVTCVSIDGGVKTNGSIECRTIKGNCHINGCGALKCDSIEGDVTSYGRVECGSIGGNVTMNGGTVEM